MCGIVGYIGKEKKVNDLINLLSMLEYRGYDSAGISSCYNGDFEIYKECGPIDNLRKIVPQDMVVNEMIGHTRWATHGASTKENAHPHQSNDKKWIMVHNGIIENYLTLKSSLHGEVASQTDTAVLVEYIAEHQVQSFYDFVNLFKNVTGSYAIICQNTEKPNELFVAKKNSPLYYSFDDDGDVYLASDPMCFTSFTNKYKTFDDNEFAHIVGKDIEVCNGDCCKLNKAFKYFENETCGITKEGYDHYMIKEINEQPEALLRMVHFYKKQEFLKKFDADFISKFKSVRLVGCGTAYHASVLGAKYFEKITGITAWAEISSEFIYNTHAFDSDSTLCIFVSQSGETADTIQALNIEKERGSTCIALTNVGYSTLAQKSDYVLPLCAGPEVSVASTKAYTCQLGALYLLAHHFANPTSQKGFDDIERIAHKLFDFDVDKVEKIAEFMADKREAIYIGKDMDFLTAREGALKIKETCYINANACQSGELKHGYIAIIDKDMPLVVIATDRRLNGRTLCACCEACARGARRIMISNEFMDEQDDFCIKLVDEEDLLMPIITAVPLQYLAYRVSILKGINPDKPRNLAKSVTVE